MKNYQQTPRQQRKNLAKAKTRLANSRNQPFQPREAWTSHRKMGGVPQSVLIEKQLNALHPGIPRYFNHFGW